MLHYSAREVLVLDAWHGFSVSCVTKIMSYWYCWLDLWFTSAIRNHVHSQVNFCFLVGLTSNRFAWKLSFFLKFRAALQPKHGQCQVTDLQRLSHSLDCTWHVVSVYTVLYCFLWITFHLCMNACLLIHLHIYKHTFDFERKTQEQQAPTLPRLRYRFLSLPHPLLPILSTMCTKLIRVVVLSGVHASLFPGSCVRVCSCVTHVLLWCVYIRRMKYSATSDCSQSQMWS